MNSYEESKFFYLSSLTVILFNIFFIGFILKNEHKEYIPPAGVITFEYWNELVKNHALYLCLKFYMHWLFTIV